MSNFEILSTYLDNRAQKTLCHITQRVILSRHDMGFQWPLTSAGKLKIVKENSCFNKIKVEVFAQLSLLLKQFTDCLQRTHL